MRDLTHSDHAIVRLITTAAWVALMSPLVAALVRLVGVWTAIATDPLGGVR